MPSRSLKAEAPSPDQARCFREWNKLKEDSGYLSSSVEMRQLRNREREAAEEFSKADRYYKTVLKSGGGDRELAEKVFTRAHDDYTGIQERVAAKEQAICNACGLYMWWDPKDKAVTWENAVGIFDPHFPVKIEKRPQGDGWITVKINLKATLGQIEGPLRKLLRLEQSLLGRPKTRSRPDTRVKEVAVFSNWNKTRSLPKTAAQLNVTLRTARRHFRNACLMIRGNFPSIKKKARTASGFTDFTGHVTDCSRCKKGAQSGEERDFCPIALAAFDQDADWGWATRGEKRGTEEGRKRRNGKLI
jgi:hypothetical protein